MICCYVGVLYCRGIVTADVLKLGLSHGAIAARKLEGVNGTRNARVYTGSAPYGEGKSLRPVEVVLIRVSMTRERDTLCPALDELFLALSRQ